MVGHNAVWAPGTTIRSGSLDYVVDNEGTMDRVPKAQTPLTKGLVDIARGLRGLHIRRCTTGPAHVEFVGMTDPVRDSFHDLLLSRLEYEHNSSYSGASHDPTRSAL